MKVISPKCNLADSENI